MKRFRHLITFVCIIAPFLASAGGQPAAKAEGAANQPIAGELQLLQGTWEGVQVGDKAQQKVTITITGQSLHFHRDANFWFETTITLPAGKAPKQLHATIKGSAPSQDSSIGQVVRTIFKFEDGTLTLATIGDDAEETPKSFEAAGTRYELRKVQPQQQNTQPPKDK
ncbi:MAG: TIGR03067 domain-containing protein [Verrucomicrobiota bacterium]